MRAEPQSLSLAETKTAERKAAAERRRTAFEASGAAAALKARDRLLDAELIAPEAAVSAYWPMGAELDTRPLLAALDDRGHRLCLPVVIAQGQPLVFRAYAPGDDLVAAGFGTRVPGEDKPEIAPDVLVVPLLAFDRAGFRLGYGGGFYDRTLQALRAKKPVLAVGYAFADQEMAEVPREATDERLDAVVTERELIRPEGAR